MQVKAAIVTSENVTVTFTSQPKDFRGVKVEASKHPKLVFDQGRRRLVGDGATDLQLAFIGEV